METATHRQVEDTADMADAPRSDVTEPANSSSDTNYMKHSSRGILLVPQPSDDPRDPLVSLILVSILL